MIHSGRMLGVVVALLLVGSTNFAEDKQAPKLSDLKVADITAVKLTTVTREITKSVEVTRDGSRTETLMKRSDANAKPTKLKDIAAADRDRLFAAALEAMPRLSANGQKSTLSERVSYQLSIEFGNRTEGGSVRGILISDKELLSAFEEIIAVIAPNDAVFSIDEMRLKKATGREFQGFGKVKTPTDDELLGDISPIVAATGQWSARLTRLGKESVRFVAFDAGIVMIRWGADDPATRSLRGKDLNDHDRAQFLSLVEQIRDGLLANPDHRHSEAARYELMIACGSRRQLIRFHGIPEDDPKQVERVNSLIKLMNQSIPAGEDLQFSVDELLVAKECKSPLSTEASSRGLRLETYRSAVVSLR